MAAMQELLHLDLDHAKISQRYWGDEDPLGVFLIRHPPVLKG
jgi:hypothetical protein